MYAGDVQNNAIIPWSSTATILESILRRGGPAKEPSPATIPTAIIVGEKKCFNEPSIYVYLLLYKSGIVLHDNHA